MAVSEEVMQSTAEVRWFFEGSIPDAVAGWFFQSDLLAEEPQREDVYLSFRSVTSTGVKFRSGRLEIKPMVTDLGVHQWSADVDGRMQTWVKWSCALPPIALLQQALAQREPFVPVGKSRVLRKYSFDRGFEEVDAATARPEDGCNLELTRLEVNDARWWTIGFEAFGFRHPERVIEILEQTVQVFAADPSRPSTFANEKSPRAHLGSDDSFSYPGWLAKLSS